MQIPSRALACAVAAALLGACSQCAEPAGPAEVRPAPGETRGDEAHPALAYPGEEPPPEPSRFSTLGHEEAATAVAGATRAGAWSALRRGGEERRSAGNFLCRLETRFGPAPVVEPSRVAFALRDEETGLLLTAYVDPGGPAFGAVLGDPPDPSRQTQAAHAVLALARLLDATVPDDCTYAVGGRQVGVEGGAYH
jgi:hypothetical protein